MPKYKEGHHVELLETFGHIPKGTTGVIRAIVGLDTFNVFFGTDENDPNGSSFNVTSSEIKPVKISPTE